jgi:hypothetical protein
MHIGPLNVVWPNIGYISCYSQGKILNEIVKQTYNIENFSGGVFFQQAQHLSSITSPSPASSLGSTPWVCLTASPFLPPYLNIYPWLKFL